MQLGTMTGYSKHISNTGHTYRTITDTAVIMETWKKEKNTLEEYHVYNTARTSYT
jgi:hypothetical protein